jgi:Mn-dependent DtxR family transcriptional regulator
MSAKEIHEMMEAGKLKVSPPNIAKYLQRLVEKKLLVKSGRGLYAIKDQMSRTYVRTRLE